MPDGTRTDPSAAVDFLIGRFHEHAEDQAVVSPAGRCSFGELADLCGRWEEACAREGVARGAVVCLAGDFSPNAIALFLALAARGAIVVPQRRNARRRERARQQEIAQVEIVVEVDGADSVSFELLGGAANHRLYDELRRRGHPGVIGLSSGSSGEPKAAVHDFVPWLDTFRASRRALSTLAFLLFDHLGGLRTMLYALSTGAKLVSIADRSPHTVCAAIERERIELLPVTPTFLNLMLLSGAHREHDLASLQTISYGAEPMSQAVLDRLREAFPAVKLQQTYGMIEIGPLRTRSRGDGSLWVKVGGEGAETRVVDGMLEVRSTASLIGYLNAPAPITADGWFETGDAVEQDGEYLRFLGRRSDLINVGGEKVHPAEVEGVIESLEEVEMAAVHGEPNAFVGQIVCAEVKPSDGATTPAELGRLVKGRCRERLERFKVPVKVALLTEHPVGDRFKKRRRAAHPMSPQSNTRDDGGQPSER